MSVLLKDSLGNIWSVGATSGGNLTTTPASGSPIPPKLFLRNSGFIYQVTIDTVGILHTTPALLTDTPQYAFIDLASSPVDWGLSVNSSGLLQTSHNGMTGAWQPNGAGAGTDNAIVGGGGGFMAYPQPPTGPRAGVVPVENDGQFGPIDITVWNGIGNYFVIANPGRSQNS